MTWRTTKWVLCLPWLPRLPRWRDENGAATIEFVFLGILTLVPLMYFALAVLDVQRNAFAATQAAREAGRAFVTADDLDTGMRRAMYAVELAVADQDLDAAGTELRFVANGTSCDSGPPAPALGAATLAPNARFSVCVKRIYRLPGVPTLLTGRDNNTITGRFVVDVEALRAEARKAKPDKS